MDDPLIIELYKKIKNSDSREFEAIMRPFFIDGLTGFYNKRYYESQLPYLQERILQDKKLITHNSNKNAYTIFFGDINNLKQTNDTKGYSVADEGIKKIIQIVNNNFESFPDRLSFRPGGDEFLILFPNTLKKDVIPHVINTEQEIASQKQSLNNMSIAIGLGDSAEFNFHGYTMNKAKEYFYSLVSSSAIMEMQKRKKEIKFGDTAAVDYTKTYFSNTIQYLFRALAIEKPTDEELQLIKYFMDSGLSEALQLTTHKEDLSEER